MQCSYGSAISHIQSGTKVLCELQYNEEAKYYHHKSLESPTAPYVTVETLQELFLRLDLQVTEV